MSSVQEQNAEKELLFNMGWGWIDSKKYVSTVKSINEYDSHIVKASFVDSQLNSETNFKFTIEYIKSVPTMNCMKEGNKGLNKKYRVIQSQ